MAELPLSEVLASEHLGDGTGAAKLVRTARAMREGGSGELLVISEFDMTLTRYMVNGKMACCSYGIIDSSPIMPDAYKKEAESLKDKYLPLESDTSLPLSTRKQAMNEWYTEAFCCHAKFNLDRKSITQMVSEANVYLRDGADEMFDVLDKNDVPLLIFSAGIGDTLMETIRQQSFIRSNMLFVSNKLRFGADDVVCDVPSQIITSYTKGDKKAFASVSDKIKGRPNVILIGESLGDPDMLNGLESCRNVIKIGFLNHSVESMLPTYLSLYDIILTGDGDMSVVNAILKEVFADPDEL